MTGKITKIDGSDEVKATLGSWGTSYRGRWQNVRVIKVGKDENTPLEVRKSLVGLIIPTIFDGQQINLQGIDIGIPDNSRLAYASSVIDALRSAGRHEEADQLKEMAPNPLHMYVFEDGTYESCR